MKNRNEEKKTTETKLPMKTNGLRQDDEKNKMLENPSEFTNVNHFIYILRANEMTERGLISASLSLSLIKILTNQAVSTRPQ